MYEGPWVAERYAATRSLIASAPESMHPVTREIILGGARTTAVDAFAAFYRLEDLRRAAQETFLKVDVLALPTAPTVYTVAQVLADPIQLNSRLGTYTNFVNLLDLCGLAVPAALHAGGTPFGITLLAPGGQDGLARHHRPALSRRHRAAARRTRPAAAGAGAVGRSGRQRRRGARGGRRASLRHAAQSRAAQPSRRSSSRRSRPRPTIGSMRSPAPSRRSRACSRVAPQSGNAIEVEVWAMPAEPFGRFVAAIPPPLSIGSIKLADGRMVKGFLVEAEAINGAQDISHFGGWRNFVAPPK